MEHQCLERNRFHPGIQAAALAFAAATAMAFAASLLKAEESGKSDGKPKMDMCCMEGSKKGGDCEGWKEKLGLTDDQTKKLDSIKEAKKAEIKPLFEKMHTLSKTLKKQLDVKASDSDIKVTLDELKSTRASLQSTMTKYRNQMSDLLTPTQQAKMFVCRMDGRHHGWMRKRHKHEEEKYKEGEEGEEESE